MKSLTIKTKSTLSFVHFHLKTWLHKIHQRKMTNSHKTQYYHSKAKLSKTTKRKEKS